MLIISCALYLEAKPLIEHFNLKPSLNAKGYKIFKNDSLKLIITGVGPTNAASAIGYVFGRYQDKISSFVNIGIAGHKDLEIGTLVLADKISQKGRKSFYPQFSFECKNITKEVISIDEDENTYPEDALYEMESFSSYEVAAKFLPLELIHSLKIVSDNKGKEAGTIDEKEVSSLIEKNLSGIEYILFEIEKIAVNFSNLQNKDASSFFDNFHFTATERYQLKMILSKLKTLSPDEIKAEQFKGKSSQEIISKLKEKLLSKPLNTP